MNAEKSSWAQAGINVNAELGLVRHGPRRTPSRARPAPAAPGSSQNWGGGWIFSPDYYPTGEEIFATGAGSNSGSYSNATNDANIKASDTTTDEPGKYENYLATTCPSSSSPTRPTAVGDQEATSTAPSPERLRHT